MVILYDKIHVTGWWYTYPFEKYDNMSWDYDIPNNPNILESQIKFMFQIPNHQQPGNYQVYNSHQIPTGFSWLHQGRPAWKPAHPSPYSLWSSPR